MLPQLAKHGVGTDGIGAREREGRSAQGAEEVISLRLRVRGDVELPSRGRMVLPEDRRPDPEIGPAQERPAFRGLVPRKGAVTELEEAIAVDEQAAAGPLGVVQRKGGVQHPREEFPGSRGQDMKSSPSAEAWLPTKEEDEMESGPSLWAPPPYSATLPSNDTPRMRVYSSSLRHGTRRP